MLDKNILINETCTVREAVKTLEENRVRGVCIVGDDLTLKGIFTEGDLRRFILNNGTMDTCIAEAMNRTPRVFHSEEEAVGFSNMVCPIVDEKNCLIGILHNEKGKHTHSLNKKCLEDVPLVIMAGGLGTRLYPLTKVIPKALIPIGEYTIAERIINNFLAWGCKEVYFIVNHKGDMIRAFFNEKEKDYSVDFVQEHEFLGTGGGLSLLKGKINRTFILSNCDILVDADYDCVLKTHNMNHNLITFIGAYKNTKIPYGVISTNNDGEILGLQEKPELSFLTNTGVYVISPEVLEKMPENQFIHITDFAMNCKNNGERIGVFPVTDEAWLDMGEFDEMKAMVHSLETQKL